VRIAVFGCGYVGLVTGACLADLGHHVVCIDKDADRVAVLNRGGSPIYEPGLDLLVGEGRQHGRLHFVTNGQAASAVAAADAVFIAVGTPSQAGNGRADLTYVRAVARDIANWARGHTVVITKSTVPVGTGDEVEALVHDLQPGKNISVASNPEFLREGSAITDFKQPDRIVIGANDEWAREVVLHIYRPLEMPERILVTSRRAAELIKYAANAFLATKITFINEIADLCEKVGVEVAEVSRGIGLDRRIGPDFLRAGPGYGGSCFPKDTRALLSTAHDHRVELRIVQEAIAANDARKIAMAGKVVDALGGSVAGCTIGVLGLAFKRDTDDVREAPSISLIKELQRCGARIRAYDPLAMEQAGKVLQDVTFADDPYDCARGTDAVVLVTDWEVLANLDLGRLHRCMNRPVFVDLWNAYDPHAMSRAGFRMAGVGNGTMAVAANNANGAHGGNGMAPLLDPHDQIAAGAEFGAFSNGATPVPAQTSAARQR
jgi:UDPglucose 6-dehydrogenase